MKKYLLAAAAALALSSPAAARDGNPYVSIEGGILFGAESDFDLTVSDGTDAFDFAEAVKLDYKTGYDVDLIGGYDFGPIRGEIELGYKRSRIDGFELSDELADAIEDEEWDEEDLEISGRTSVVSVMGNALLDLGGNGGLGFYAGGGAGRAWVDVAGEKDSVWAWQLIAGARSPISENVDVGLKYRFFNTAKTRFQDGFDDFTVAAEGKFRSHSLLASLTYNFGPRSHPQAVAPAPAPAAPVPPVMQSCADGSVIPATDICPAPLAPPPPPPLGERG